MQFLKTQVLPAARAHGLSATRAVTTVWALATVLCLLCWQIAHQHALPVYDDIRDHLKLYRAADVAAFFTYLFSNHNEHHVLTTRLLTAADSWLWGGQLHLQAIAANLLQLMRRGTSPTACLPPGHAGRQRRQPPVGL